MKKIFMSIKNVSEAYKDDFLSMEARGEIFISSAYFSIDLGIA